MSFLEVLSSPYLDGGRSVLVPLARLTQYVKSVHSLSITAVANHCFGRWLYIFSYFPKSERVYLHAHVRPLLLSNKTNGQRQPTFGVPSNFTLCTTTAPAHPSFDCSPTASPWVLNPSMFLAYFSVFPTAVDRWDGLSDDTNARFRFGVSSSGSGQGGVDDGL